MMSEHYDDEQIDPVENLTTRLHSTFNHHISVMDSKRALGEITEETYLLFLEHTKEYRKVPNG